MSDKEDGEVLSEGELEDGELPSSDEEDDTAKDEELLNPPKSPPSLQAESEQHHAAQKRPLPEEEAGAAEKLTPEQKVVSVINFLTISFVTSHRITSSTFAAIIGCMSIFGGFYVTKFSILLMVAQTHFSDTIAIFGVYD